VKSFFSNLWGDLREKRLWPVAVLLLAALVAVPVVLKKSPEEPPPAPPIAAGQRNAPESEELKGLATVTLEDAGVGDGSSLDTFDPANPFRPPERVVEEGDEESGEGAPGADEVILSDEVVEGGSGGGDIGSGGDRGGGTGGGTDGTGGTGDGDAGGDGTTTETTEYAYVLDVTFSNNGRTRKIKGMERLDMLPSAASPLLLFLGVSSNAGNAVFLVDSTLDAAGEGKCKPSQAECAFLHLGAGSEHMFTTEDGDSYRLRVDQIRKVRVGDDASASASSNTPHRAGAALAGSRGRRRFTSPLISDLVSVSSTEADSSTGHGDRR
jgi:hypothetical protein